MSEAGGYDAQALHGFAHDSIAQGSKSFALASQLFDRITRERVWLLYAWCRAADDLVDGQDHGGPMGVGHDAQAALARIRALTDRAFAGEPTGEAAFDALGLLLTEIVIPRAVIDDIIAGFELDADDWRPRSEADLLRYAYHVAGAVGVAMAHVMGIDPADETTLDRASDLGIAFQLANIARDIAEDAAADRCYLPDEWLAELDIPPGQHMHPAFRSRLSVMAKWLAEMAEEYEASARWGARKLRPRSRWAVLAATGIYGDIAREVRRRGDHAWDHRASSSLAAKLGWVARAGWSVLRRPPQRRISREGLWTRSRTEKGT
ncbi:phytoene/squalene synthase family protein [Sphingopyxis sp. 113P3]|uniref:phytoene/squalene synthase family protein n=1 Tax=Sphingopyxis sp. (strain 113P3) TaxID=292913 RepID=UPI0006AD125C|nr:phytoene/squalene synthase family protein [Sphingopyxis sp. 113P3]ALC10596.1 phytoene synthase [Sphingopyxis sp. 113P3]